MTWGEERAVLTPELRVATENSETLGLASAKRCWGQYDDVFAFTSDTQLRALRVT